MSTVNDKAGSSSTGPRIPGEGGGSALRVWAWIVDGLAAVGTVMIGILMLIICSDVVARNLMGSSLPLVSELGALTLVMIVFLQLGTTVRHDRLAKTEIFQSVLARSNPRLGLVVTGVFELVGAAMCGLMAWSTFRIVGKDLSSGEFIGVTGVLTLPTWPFRILIMIGITVAALQFILQAGTKLRRVLSAGAGR